MKKILLSLSAMTLALPMFASQALAEAIIPPQPSERLSFYRLYNPTINDHFYTSSSEEVAAAVASSGYTLEGIMGYVERHQQSGTQTILRMWNPAAMKHFYTTSHEEMRLAESSGFVLEGTPGYMMTDDPPIGDGPTLNLWEGLVPVYRLYNSAQRKHFYTTDSGERDILIAYGGYASENQLGGGLFNFATVVQ